MRDNSYFLIKGLKEGILVNFISPEFKMAREALFTHINSNQSFFKGAKMLLDVGNTSLKAAELGKLRDDLADEQVTLTAIISSNEISMRSGELLGLIVNPTDEKKKQVGKVNKPDFPLWVGKSIRSGTRIDHMGNVIIVGDINPGAEVIATGNIVVWGRIKGFVHAGKSGDTTAFICALELKPTQLRIADMVAVSPEKQDKYLPEMIRIIDGQLVAEAWNEK
ncbi:MAG TPA: septum site-determining protein MinC [Anaerolineales bacterium]|nr:septum site-determining protein MinC [Anaerolineales bacterium]